jgi:hypothetical protein
VTLWTAKVWEGGIESGECWFYLVSAPSKSEAITLVRKKSIEDHPKANYVGMGVDDRPIDDVKQVELHPLEAREVAKWSWGW